MTRTREEILRDIAVIFTDNNNGPDEGWDSDEITEAVHDILCTEGAYTRCGYCSEYYPVDYDECPWSEYHNVCEYCSCEECECRICQRCEELADECRCPEEEAVFV